MVSNDSCPSWAAYTTMISDLGFEIQDQTQCQFTGTGYRLGITSARVPAWFQTMASLPGQHMQPQFLNWHLTFKVRAQFKFKV